MAEGEAAKGRAGGDQLLAYRVGRRWHPVRSDEYSAKDFRTWNAAVLAAVSLAADGRDAVSNALASAPWMGASRESRKCWAIRG